jgi:hypothetical protein
MNIFSLVSLPYRIPMLVGLALAAGGFCYVKGLTHAAATHAEFVAKVQAAGAATHAEFVAKVQAAGEAAEAARTRDTAERKNISIKQEAESEKRYETLDAKYHAALAIARGVPNTNPGGGQAQPLSSATPLLSCPSGSTDVARGLEQLEVGVLALLDRGNKAIARTTTCKSWLNEQVAK